MTVYLLCYAAAVLLAAGGHAYLSGAGLLGAAVYLYLEDYWRTGNLLHLRALFSLSFVGGEGLACLKLSRLATTWRPMTWLCFLAAFLGFYMVYGWLERQEGKALAGNGGAGRRGRDAAAARRRLEGFSGKRSALFFCAAGLTAVSLLCFLIEAAVLGFVPLLVRGVPHAYSTFHLTGIHYFTVSCVLVPSLTVLYLCIDRGRGEKRCVLMLAFAAAALAIPILCVSRFQLLFAVLLAVLTYMQAEGRLRLGYVAAALAFLFGFYLLLTVARSHDTAYLNAIFEMKEERTPIFITQPYMYIANNYDNFNCLVEQLPGHSWGLKSLAPFWALTGLKFLFPMGQDLPIFVTREELTTLTLFYDAYYDFGLAGVIAFSCLLGAAAWWLTDRMRELKNPVLYLFYAQMALYLMLSFFTSWFSLPSTWFYLAATGAMAWVVGRWR